MGTSQYWAAGPARLGVLALALATGALMAASFARADASIHVADDTSLRWQQGPVVAPPSGDAIAGFGTTLALGDINSDGATDVVVGAPAAETGTRDPAGRVFVYFGPDFRESISLSDPEPQSGARFGAAAVVADLDGDGNADIVVGAPGTSADSMQSPESVAGKVVIFAGPEWSETRTLEPSPGDGAPGFGGALAVGDITGDGAIDLVVSDTSSFHVDQGPFPSGPPPVVEEGVRIYWGPNLEEGPLLRSASRSVFGSCSIWECSQFGAAVAVADVDGDDLEDLLVGEWHRIDSNSAQGSVYVFRAPDLTLATRVRSLQSGRSVSDFGIELATGDFDSDGAGDVVVGDPTPPFGPWPPGAMPPSGQVTLVTRLLTDDGPARLRLKPAATADPNLGGTLAVADVNGDGQLDILLGAHEPEDQILALLGPTFTDGPRITGVTGTHLAAGDLNGDGRAVVVAQTPDEQVAIFYSAADDGG